MDFGQLFTFLGQVWLVAARLWNTPVILQTSHSSPVISVHHSATLEAGLEPGPELLGQDVVATVAVDVLSQLLI